MPKRFIKTSLNHFSILTPLLLFYLFNHNKFFAFFPLYTLVKHFLCHKKGIILVFYQNNQCPCPLRFTFFPYHAITTQYATAHTELYVSFTLSLVRFLIVPTYIVPLFVSRACLQILPVDKYLFKFSTFCVLG